MPAQKTKVLAISSGGGHWVQLLRLRPAFEGCDVTFATTHAAYRSDIGRDARFRVVPDSNYSKKLKLIYTAFSVLWLLISERPHVVVSTGAAPGYFALRTAKWLGVYTVWIDSVANAEVLSLAGQKAGECADLWLTQWPHLAREDGPRYVGSVL